MRPIPPRINSRCLAAQGRGCSCFMLQRGPLALRLALILACTQAQSLGLPHAAAALSPPLIAQATAQQLIFVNPIRGDDDRADGTQRSPFRTITRALQAAQQNTILLLAAGTYSTSTGELFPIVMKTGVTLQGDPSTKGRGIVIQGGGTFPSAALAGGTVTLVGANRAGLTGVTVNNDDAQGYGLWIESSSPTIINNTFTGNAQGGIAVRGTSTPLIEGNRLAENRSTGISIAGQSQPELRENLVERSDVGVTISETAAPRLIQNQIRQNRTGVLVQENARPLLQENTIEANTEDGLVAIGQSQPNLGTATEPGNNRFQNNRRYGVNATATPQTIPAFGNPEGGDRTAGKLDRTGTSPITSPTIATASPLPNPSPASPASSPANRLTRRPSAAITQLPPAVSSSSPEQTAAATTPAASRAPAAVAQVSLTAPTGSTASNASASPGIPVSSPPASSTAIALQVPQPPAMTTVTVQGRPAAVAAAPVPQVTSPQVVSPQAVSSQITSPRTVSPRVASLQLGTAPLSAMAISTPPPAASNRGTPQAPTATAAASGRVVSIRSSSRQAMAFAPLAASSNSPPIDIPVPPPESGNVPPPPRLEQSSASSSTATLHADLLPVPGTEVPVGNTGDMPRVNVSRSAVRNAGGVASVGQQSPPMELKYRVVVEADDEMAEALVRTLAPGAFFVDSSDRDLMQVGAFSTRDNAEEARDLFRGKGLSANIQRIQ